MGQKFFVQKQKSFHLWHNGVPLIDTVHQKFLSIVNLYIFSQNLSNMTFLVSNGRT